jgi:hypothetical protein
MPATIVTKIVAVDFAPTARVIELANTVSHGSPA